jgi:hypothetical protein
LLGFLFGKWKIQKGQTPGTWKNGANHTHTGTLSAHFIHTSPFVIFKDPKEKGEN